MKNTVRFALVLGVVLLLSAPKALLLFGLIDFISAMWTLLALRKDVAASRGSDRR